MNERSSKQTTSKTSANFILRSFANRFCPVFGWLINTRVVDIIDGTRESKAFEESTDLPVQAWKIQEQGLLPFAELKIPKACNYVGKKPPGQFGCSRCGRSYMRKDSLQRHVHWECGKEPQFQCPFCPQRCKRKAHWLRHIRRQHLDKIGDMEAYLLAYTPKLEID